MPTTAPLILLHGFPMDRRLWTAQVAGLSDVARVTTVDFRGFGADTGDDPFTIADLADDVHRLIVGMDEPCVVGGLSMGGYVALALAARYPDDLRGLILLDTKATADDDAAKAGREAMIALARTAGATAVATQMLAKTLSPQVSPDVKATVRTMMESVRPTTIVHALTAMRDRPDRSAALGRIAVPTLCVVGADDAATPPPVVEDMRRQISAARPLVIIERAGHLTPIEQPAATTAALRAFLASL